MLYTPFIKEQLELASEVALHYFGQVSSTVKPGDNNQVLTEADIAIGKQLVQAIKSAYPDHNIIDEETGITERDSTYTWVIDPIDGTSNFAAGLPDYGIMVGLLEDGTPIAGGVSNPSHNRLYLAEKDCGATLNGNPIHVTDEESLANVLVSYGVDGEPNQPGLNQRQCAVLADILPKIRNFRNSGSEAIDDMYVADGRYGGRVNLYAKIWDAVAPHIICTEAGAVWTTANGHMPDYSMPLTRVNENFTFCAASPVLHQQLQAIIAGRLA
jgi:myo-inositol-1(or 4)-monophosphatase